MKQQSFNIVTEFYDLEVFLDENEDVRKAMGRVLMDIIGIYMIMINCDPEVFGGNAPKIYDFITNELDESLLGLPTENR